MTTATGRKAVLVLDTCMLLDIVRAPTRDGLSHACIDAAGKTLELASSTADLELVVPAPVLTEFRRSLPNVRKVASDDLTRLLGEHGRFRRTMEAAGFRPEDLGNIAVSVEECIDSLCSLAESIVLRSTVEAPRADEESRATRRVIDDVPPARKGGGAGDSLVTEMTIRLSNSGRAAPGGAVVLASSNTNDYTEGGAKLREPIGSEFDAAGIKFAKNWPTALVLSRRLVA